MNTFPVPFIVGVPRSGTTLLRLMLDTHPELAIPPETFFVPLVGKIQGDDDDTREHFFRAVVGARVWGDFHLSERVFYESLQQARPFNVTAGLRCFYSLYAQRFSKRRWGDKTPGYNTMMNAIESVLPEAHFIHIVRDGRDVALSHKEANFWWAAEGFKDHAQYWRDTIQETHRQAGTCKHFLEIRYEDLIRETTSTLRKVCDFIRLPYVTQLEQFYHLSQARLDEFIDLKRRDGSIIKAKVERLQLHHRTTAPPDQSRVGRWRQEMSSKERNSYEAVAKSMLLKFNYEISMEYDAGSSG